MVKQEKGELRRAGGTCINEILHDIVYELRKTGNR